jgi:hypothetical protein
MRYAQLAIVPIVADRHCVERDIHVVRTSICVEKLDSDAVVHGFLLSYRRRLAFDGYDSTDFFFKNKKNRKRL